MSWLSLLPLKVEESEGYTNPGKDLINPCNFYLSDVPDLSGDQFPAWFQALSPLRGALATVKCLSVRDPVLTPTCLRSLTDFFSGAEKLMLLDGRFHELSLSECLLASLRGMPRLRKMVVDMSRMGDTSEFLAPLIEAREARQEFQLDIMFLPIESELRAKFEALINLWDASTRLLARGPSVKIAVHTRDPH